MKHLLTIFVLLWAFPAHATMTVLGNAKAAHSVHGFIPCIVSLDGSPAYRLERTVPGGTGDIVTWLNANVPAGDEAGWKAAANRPGFTPAVIPDDWDHAGFDFSDLPPKMRAILLTLLDENNTLRDEINVIRAELDALRALHSIGVGFPAIPQRTGQQAISAVKAKLNE